MNTYNDKLARYYDEIYLDKDYTKESEYITQVVDTHNVLLDVGCGTMTHTTLLAAKFKQVFAVDLSKPMIDVGLEKLETLNIKNVAGICCDISKLDIPVKADCAISMFNVINHIENIKDLELFFKAINSRLNSQGKFIFDCWNGVACTIEKPREHSSKIKTIDNKTIELTTTTETNLFDSVSTMKTNIVVKENNLIVDSFSYNLTHILWNNHVLKDLLKSTGFSVETIFPNVTVKQLATIQDYRLVYTCRKIT